MTSLVNSANRKMNSKHNINLAKILQGFYMIWFCTEDTVLLHSNDSIVLAVFIVILNLLDNNNYIFSCSVFFSQKISFYLNC